MRTKKEVQDFLEIVTDKMQEYYTEGIGYTVSREDKRVFDCIAVQQAMLKWFLGEEL